MISAIKNNVCEQKYKKKEKRIKGVWQSAICQLSTKSCCDSKETKFHLHHLKKLNTSSVDSLRCLAVPFFCERNLR